MLVDSTFYFIAIPAVLLVGLSKGGMGDALGLLGVPILSFAVPAVQAAAILLPILVMMDLVALWTWRKHSDTTLLKYMLPGAMLGLAIGWATSVVVPDFVMRLIIGFVAVSFAARFFHNRYFAGNLKRAPAQHNAARAGLWSTLSGYGSFVAHAGGAPFQVYGLPLQLPPAEYTGAAIRFFAILNAIKLVPYYMLGELDLSNLYISATLFPIAPVSTIVGAMIVRRMRPDFFYPFMYLMCALAGAKLVFDGAMPLISG